MAASPRTWLPRIRRFVKAHLSFFVVVSLDDDGDVGTNSGAQSTTITGVFADSGNELRRKIAPFVELGCLCDVVFGAEGHAELAGFAFF